MIDLTAVFHFVSESTPTTDAPSSSSDASPSVPDPPPADSWEDEADNGEGMLFCILV